ncbi:tRNA (adenosine(37)-N6)-dimethylallyltransferase MiaA [Thiocystis violacea]|uniref:tRNA (adenosine(37)-N6)-dimethylallyltransferase MiaA n=1 Tax=Thiocystis violacea TaxID=13725 RepID=UPI001906F0B2|nr:tRNA (adenosine(37)-N6)-dimethylallyltransferase MiaA [Thiocystis violacea]MBK1718819.1 tRNA (adenosine(37)-N6)-dimethylallyltransferase MiaA [Thiocystis violacea]
MATLDPQTDRRPWAILLMGPTASGKTALAVQLVERLPCEIISVDSAMIYRGMDIGTAKPEPEILARAPHRLVDILDPTESYSTARFREEALAAMTEIRRRGRIPLLVGGTMLYFRALQQGLAKLPSADPDVRVALLEEAERIGWVAMHARLVAVDPQGGARIHPNDPQRIQRALEVHALTGRAMSDLIEAAESERFPFRLLKLARAPSERSSLHERIERRFGSMLELGLVDEVSALWSRGDLHPDLPSMRCVGYRQVLKYLLGECNWDDMRYRGLVATRQLAKRQMTWLRSEPECHWLADEPGPLSEVLALLEVVMEGGLGRLDG